MDPIEQAPNETPFTLRELLAEGGKLLELEVVTGGPGLEHVVLEPMCNRPGLALTGFYGYFAWRRLQLIGQAERAYLLSLEPEVRLARIKALFDRSAYCLIFACGVNVPAEFAQCAQEAGAVVLRTTLPTRVFSHRCAFVLEKLRAPKMRIYGTTVEVAGLGVMLEGKSGLGKSETALGLIKHGNALVADDVTCLRKNVAADELYASAAPNTKNFMEIRGVGFIDVSQIFGVTSICPEKRLDLVVTLMPFNEVAGDLDRTGLEQKYRTILGVQVPQIIIPVAPGRDLVNLIETAAQYYKQRANGQDSAQLLESRICARHAALGGTANKI